MSIEIREKKAVMEVDALKKSMLSVKQLSILMGVKAERLYGVNKGKVRMTVEEYRKLEYINSVLDQLAQDMKEW